MAKYVRKTHDEWHTQGYYCAEIGWETETIDDNEKDGKQSLRDYRENVPNVPHRLKKIRVRNEGSVEK